MMNKKIILIIFLLLIGIILVLPIFSSNILLAPAESVIDLFIQDDENGNQNQDDDTTCGDGIVNGNEQCDDSNTNEGDGCSATCQIETPNQQNNQQQQNQQQDSGTAGGGSSGGGGQQSNQQGSEPSDSLPSETEKEEEPQEITYIVNEELTANKLIRSPLLGKNSLLLFTHFYESTKTGELKKSEHNIKILDIIKNEESSNLLILVSPASEQASISYRNSITLNLDGDAPALIKINFFSLEEEKAGIEISLEEKTSDNYITQIMFFLGLILIIAALFIIVLKIIKSNSNKYSY